MQHGINYTSGVTQLVLIDGQQRLTTLSLLLSALGRAIETKNVDICVDRSQLERGYLFNDREKGKLRYKQLLTKHDKKTLIQLLEEGVAPQLSVVGVKCLELWSKSEVTPKNVIHL